MRLQDTKQQRTDTATEATAATNTTEAQEPPTITRLQHPIIHDNEGFDEGKLQKGMNKEMDQMKKHDVYEEASTDNVDKETLHDAIDSRWVHKNKTPTEVRSRIVAKFYKEEIEDLDDIYASTPLFVILQVLLTVAMARSWRIRLGHVPTAFLHVPLGNQHVYIWPPKEYYPEGATLWRLARGLRQPTEADWKKAKHLLRYPRGTSNYTQQLRPTTTLNTSKAVLDVDIHVDAGWAGCPSTRESTTGFVIYILGTPVSFGSRAQATIAFSSAESELYAICTGTSEGLHLKMFLQESGLAKVNIRIHTDSTARRSIATRQGTSKKAKHIDIR